jgi:hypothetical protein
MHRGGDAFTFKLCGAVDPSVKQQSLYNAAKQSMNFELRLVYIADDDLAFISQCTHQWDEYAANMHREPYHSVALSNSGQTFIISVNGAPACVAEVHHALQYYTGDEIIPKSNDYFVRLFFVADIDKNVLVPLLQFFTEFCSRFKEVSGLIMKPESLDNATLVQAGFTAHTDEDGTRTGIYYYSTSKPNE